MPSFQKSLIVEEFQRNYLKLPIFWVQARWDPLGDRTRSAGLISQEPFRGMIIFLRAEKFEKSFCFEIPRIQLFVFISTIFFLFNSNVQASCSSQDLWKA